MILYFYKYKYKKSIFQSFDNVFIQETEVNIRVISYNKTKQ